MKQKKKSSDAPSLEYRRLRGRLAEIGWVAFAWQFAGEKEAHFERHEYGRPQ